MSFQIFFIETLFFPQFFMKTQKNSFSSFLGEVLLSITKTYKTNQKQQKAGHDKIPLFLFAFL